MRLALADIKKTVSRRGGVTRITPYLLRRGELASEIAALIALYESWVGRERAGFPVDRAAELIGDYRLARCLTNCLAEDYEWQPPEWPDGASDEEAAALASREIRAPGQLRLALYGWVNDHAGGYLAAATREEALNRCAADLAIRRATLDRLLTLDGEAQAILHRSSETAPTSDALARRYNQRAFETLMYNAGSVEWVVPPDIGQTAGEPLGTVVKRLCFLARTMGVHYDLAFDEEKEAPGASLARVAESRAAYAVDGEDGAAETETETETLDAAGRPIRVLLYGPQEVSAAPAAYGERLARLCRALLGYRRAPERTRGRATLAGDGLYGVAQIYLHGRPLPMMLDERLLKLLGVGVEDQGEAGEASAPASVSYDSALEARFASEFAALERSDAAHGWRLEREPEPLLVGETILVPDFALTRGMRRVYLEIAGYWRPGYRERKARKLAALRGRVTLAIAAPEAARGELGVFEGAFPLLWYTRDHIRAHELIALLDRSYDDSARRLATLDLPRITDEVRRRGRIPPRESYALLHSYTRAELDVALRALAGGRPANAPQWVEGLGLCDPGWLTERLERLRAAVTSATHERLPLAELTATLRESEVALADLDEATVESLAERAGMLVARASIFAAEVIAPGADHDEGADEATNAENKALASERRPRQAPQPMAQPRPRARRKQHRQDEDVTPGKDIAQLNFFPTDRAEDENG